MALPRLLSTQEAADALGLMPQTLEAWRSTKRYSLPWVKVGRLVRYREDHVQRFLEARTEHGAQFDGGAS